MLKNVKKKRNNKGFTLVELLVVIAIIGILAVVAVPSLFKNIDKAKATQVVTNVKALKTEILTEYANSNTDTNLVTDDGKIFSTANITKLLELNENNEGKLGETYKIVDVGTTTDNQISIVIDCKDRLKAEIVETVLDGSKLADKSNEVVYLVGKK